MTQHGKVLGPVSGAQPTLIFAKGDVECPMELVLNPPVFAHGLGKLWGLGRQAGQIEALLDAGLPAQGARGFHHADAAQPRPRRRLEVRVQLLTDPRAARLHPPMSLLRLLCDTH